MLGASCCFACLSQKRNGAPAPTSTNPPKTWLDVRHTCSYLTCYSVTAFHGCFKLERVFLNVPRGASLENVARSGPRSACGCKTIRFSSVTFHFGRFCRSGGTSRTSGVSTCQSERQDGSMQFGNGRLMIMNGRVRELKAHASACRWSAEPIRIFEKRITTSSREIRGFLEGRPS